MTKWSNISTAPPARRCLWLRASGLILAGVVMLLVGAYLFALGVGL